MASVGPSRNQELLLGGWQRPKDLGHLLLFLQAINREMDQQYSNWDLNWWYLRWWIYMLCHDVRPWTLT